MKARTLLTILLFPLILSGQALNHFNNPDSRWSVAKTFPDGNPQNPNFVTTYTLIYGFMGDTLINNEQWLKLWSTTDETFQNNLLYRGLIRSENNQIFYINPMNQLETLYNFNLDAGDSVLYEVYDEPQWLTILHIDSIELNGEYYKKFIFEEPALFVFDVMNEAWIEGIGSVHGPVFPSDPRSFSTEVPDSMMLTCSFYEEQQIWHHPSYSSCFVYIIMGMEKNEIPGLEVYPNPITDKAKIENPEQKNLHVYLLNASGQIIRQLQSSSTDISINISELSSGLYYLRVRDGKNSDLYKVLKK